MKLAIYDLDDTLLCGDSEFKWAQFNVKKGLIAEDLYIKKISKFEKDYRSGNLDFEAYCKFLINPLVNKHINEVKELVREFISEYKHHLIDKVTYELLERHDGDKIIIASGSLDFIVEGFSELFSVSNFLGSPIELKEGIVTGNLGGTPTFAEGKLKAVSKWCEDKNYILKDAFFYTDSINDLPLVKACKNSIIISPDKKLKMYAESNSLEIVNR
jgi:HAD superfamily hydrolase (TIGR01490 family)|tara:strand:+ start:3856 stop:4500 length:645 start_codon:yes stop_codon:yes gene_type:complete